MTRPKIVLLGMLTKIPVGGVIWLVAQYMEGFRRLGFDPYYVEAHARTPSMFMTSDDDDPTPLAVQFLDAQMRRFGFGDSWAFHALHDDGSVHGPVASKLEELYRDAALIINLHGGTVPLDEHAASGRLVYLGTDPVELELEVRRGEQRTLEFLDAHCAYFTWGLNQAKPGCRVPSDDRYPLIASPPPVILDWWQTSAPPGDTFTTVGNWRQPWRTVEFEGETYTWSKHHEFQKVLDLPCRVDQPLELALSSYDAADQEMLEAHGWRVRSAIEVSRDADTYRDYIQGSRGEFSVAKDQNVRLRSGWFSERSATYLAAGRPVVVQDTGFGSFLPTGEGLLPFSDLEGAAAAIDKIGGDLVQHATAAEEIARAHLGAERVLGALLTHVGEPTRRTSSSAANRGGRRVHIPFDLDLQPVSRRPLKLDDATVDRIMALPLPPPRERVAPRASIVVVTWNNLPLTRLCLESVLTNTSAPDMEVIVVDNASNDGSPQYLERLSAIHPCVQVVRNAANCGFARASNQGLERAHGDVLVLLNNDTVVPPGWLGGLRSALRDPSVGVAGPVTNDAGNEARIAVGYRTYGEMLSFAHRRSEERPGQVTDLPMLTLFCAAIRRDTYERVGPLDEAFEVGMFEDDDFSERIHRLGLRTVCAESVFVHHFGEASFGQLRPSGAWSRIFANNRERFEQKWKRSWSPHQIRQDPGYLDLVDLVTEQLGRLPERSGVAVISRGDDALLRANAIEAVHFPALPDGRWSGHYPGDGAAAVHAVEEVASRGIRYLAIPRTANWWLEHYPELRERLAAGYIVSATSACTVYDLEGRRGTH